MFGCLLEATKILLQSGLYVKLLFGFHPGDKLDRQFYIDHLFNRCDVPVLLTSDDTIPRLGDALPGADVVINIKSTLGIQAGYLGIPSICFLSIFTRTMMLRDTGVDVWEPCDTLDIAQPLREISVDNLLCAISSTTNEEKARNRVFPQPFEPGKCLRLMVRAIEEI